MKIKQNSFSLLIAIFTLISVFAVGAMYLSLERSKQASISSEISKLNKQMEILNRRNLDLTSRIANLESPNNLKMRLGTLSPISESMLVIESYDSAEKTTKANSENIALGYGSPNRIGTIN